MKLDRQLVQERISKAFTYAGQMADKVGQEALEAAGLRKVERWTMPQVRFSEEARAAARAALWFLRLVERDSDQKLRLFAARNAHRCLAEVAIPPEDTWCKGGEGEQCEYSGAIEPAFSDLVAQWKTAVEALAPVAPPAGGQAKTVELTAQRLAELELGLARFIVGSKPYYKWLRFTYANLPALWMVLRRYSVSILALGVATGVCIGVEAVRNLLRNEPLLGMVVVGALGASVLVVRSLRGLWNRRGRAAPWEIGARVVHGLPASAKPQPWIPWHPAGYEKRVYRSLGLKALLYLVIWTLLAGLMALLVATGAAPPIGFTTYLIVAACGLIVLLGSMVDFADMHSRAPLRGIILLGVALVSGAIYTSDSRVVFYSTVAGWMVAAYYWARQVRIPRAVVGVPAALIAIVVVTYGLGEWRRYVDERAMVPTGANAQLDSVAWPRGDRTSGPIVVIAASGGGSRAAVFTARTLAALDSQHAEVARRIQVISSVSGGSLANAAYVARGLRSGSAEPVMAGCQESLVDAVSQDFLRPVLLGVLWGGRGAAIQRAWEKCPVGLEGMDMAMVARRWNADASAMPPFPLPIFNSVSLERHAVVITPLQQGYFALDFDATARSLESNEYLRHELPTWVHYRSGIYHFGDLTASPNTRLSAAVRASANFPFGFPLVEISTDKKLWYSLSISRDTAPRTTMVRLTDGGALSNSGMWPLLPLLMNRREQIGADRGVLLIAVDASRMPRRPSLDRQRGLIGTILDKHPKGDRVHALMLDQLQLAFGECFGYVHVGLPPSERFNVYTTWALDGRSLDKLHKAFDASWASASNEIASEFQRLKSCKSSTPRKRAPTRVPID